MFCLLIILVLPWLPVTQSFCDLKIRVIHQTELKPTYQDGDLIIGVLLTRFTKPIGRQFQTDNSRTVFCLEYGIQKLLQPYVFVYAIHNINQNPDILPNITLGYHLYDTCSDGQLAIRYVLHLLSGPNKMIPNYSCTSRGQLAGVIGDQYSSTTIPVAQLLGLYGYPQISYGASDPSLSDRLLYPHVFRMVQNYHIHNMVISELLEHFGWTWVGIILSNDETGEDELHILTKYMRERGICAAFIITLRNKNYNRILQAVNDPQVTIIIMCGTFFPHIIVLMQYYEFIFLDTTFILSPSWISTAPEGIIEDLLVYNGSLAVKFSSFFPGLEDFKKTYRKHDEMDQIQSYWRLLDDLAKSNDIDSFISDYVINKEHNYTQNYTVPNLRDSFISGVIPRLYSAVEVLAKALHEMFLFIKDEYEESSITGFIHYRRKLQRYIQMMKSSPDPLSPSYYFNEQGEVVHPYEIINWLYIGEAMREVVVGNYTPWAISGEKLHINWQSITWRHKKEIPVSRCSDQCSLGSRKKSGGTIHACCYDCVPCSEGEISNITDAEDCVKCQSDEWPNEKRDRCLPKVLEFISYQNDTMASVFSCVSVFGCLVTGFIFGIFIFYRGTPIVKANNRNLSYLLLVSIILSFLSVFLFLGRPSDATCRLRETSFGIFFSIAVSSLLAKTTMVCVAFKSTKPGSPWRKWLNVKLPYTIVLLCSSIQVVICVIWLSISPPYQDLDTLSYPEKIIIQCNEGSDICFYSMLGYMGLLAAVSFVLAFTVRTLPDSFNEAKYITFSMLLFCSVWISMIPAYLSTRGKYMVVVEIFAVMASSAGLLGCVFLPKCFIILFKSEMNRKIDLLGKRSNVGKILPPDNIQ